MVTMIAKKNIKISLPRKVSFWQAVEMKQSIIALCTKFCRNLKLGTPQ
jgi:hypothetical protein